MTPIGPIRLIPVLAMLANVTSTVFLVMTFPSRDLRIGRLESWLSDLQIHRLHQPRQAHTVHQSFSQPVRSAGAADAHSGPSHARKPAKRWKVDLRSWLPGSQFDAPSGLVRRQLEMHTVPAATTPATGVRGHLP